MAKIEGRQTMNATITMALTEGEAAALDAIVGYGFDSFKEVFYKHLGEAYLKPHEAGLKSLFESIRTGEASVSEILKRAAHARKVFSGEMIATKKESK